VHDPNGAYWFVPGSDYFDEDYDEKYDTDYDNALTKMRMQFPCTHEYVGYLYTRCPWKSLSQKQIEAIRTEIYTQSYLDNIKWGIQNSIKDGSTKMVLKSLRVQFFKTLPPLLHCQTEIQTTHSSDWFKSDFKEEFDEFQRSSTFDGDSNEIFESITLR
jgi:hypothetical protein